LDPADPIKSARIIIGRAFTDVHGLKTLHRHRGEFWQWTGTEQSCYRQSEDEMLGSQIWKFLEKAKRKVNTAAKGEPPVFTPVPFKPKRSNVAEVREALGAVCQLDKYLNPPIWLSKKDMPAAEELFACANGLLHLPTGVLHPASPDFFGLSSSEVIFDPNAAKPERWLQFLTQVFGDDQEQIDLLQEDFGYSLSADTSQEKIFLMVGPIRCGKGTTARVQTTLLGKHSVAGPSMGELAASFGLEDLITKPYAIISDARIGARTDKSVIVERLLSISGEDRITVPRKFLKAWNGTLPTRIKILTNELPSLNDGSGALVSRLLIYTMKNSFYGKEDPELTRKLITELSGILNWAIEGYRRLHKRGHFVQPASSREAINDLLMLAAPVKEFIHTECDTGAEFSVDVDGLWSAWKSWCEKNGRHETGSKAWFGRNLKTAVPSITKAKPKSGDGRARIYNGIRLKLEM
jgi:putative DNA primase/helicase